jgi:hypothetical protein
MRLEDSIRAYDQREIGMEDPLDRIRYHLKNYRSNFYSVKRTSSTIRNLERALKPDMGSGLKERMVPILDLLDGKGALLDGLFMGRQIGQSMVDERGCRTLPDRQLEGREYALSLTRNADVYLDLIEREVRARCASVQDHRIAGLRDALQSDLESYFDEKAKPGRRSLAKLSSKLRDRIAEFQRMRGDGTYSKSVEALLTHVLSHRQRI